MRIVIALGGNALLRRGEPMTTDRQRADVKIAAQAIAPLAATGKGGPEPDKMTGRSVPDLPAPQGSARGSSGPTWPPADGRRCQSPAAFGPPLSAPWKKRCRRFHRWRHESQSP